MGNIKTVVFALMAMFSVGAMAEAKIAICNIGQAIASSEVAKKRIAELEAESNMGTLQAEYEGKVADAQALEKDFETNNLSWDDQRKAKYQRDRESLAADLQLIQRKAQNEQKALQQVLLQELQPVALQQLDELIKEEKVDILLRSEAVHWNSGSADLTNKLIDRINKTAAKK